MPGAHSSAFFGFVFLGFVGRFVAPRVGLGSWNNPCDIRVFAGVTFTTTATTLAGFSSPRRFFLLLFRASPLSLALAPRQWIPCSHLPIL